MKKDAKVSQNGHNIRDEGSNHLSC